MASQANSYTDRIQYMPLTMQEISDDQHWRKTASNKHFLNLKVWLKLQRWSWDWDQAELVVASCEGKCDGGACAEQAWPWSLCSSVWWRRGILGQLFPQWTKCPFVCHSGPGLAGLHHALLRFRAELGFPPQRALWRGAGGTEGGTGERRGESAGGGRKDVAWALGIRQVTLPLLHSPSPAALTTQWLLLSWNFTLLDPKPGVLSSHNVQAAEHAAGETHSAS